MAVTAGGRSQPAVTATSGGHNIDTGAVLVAHAMLISGVGLTPAFGSASLDVFALGASLVLLALIVMKSPKPLSQRRRPTDIWQRAARLGREFAAAGRNSWWRFRQRIDLLLVQMLGDPGDRPQSRASAPTRGYQSKHRLCEPPRESANPKQAPRHAAPPREPLSPPN